MYAMTQTRPDLAYSIAYLSRYLNSPTELLFKAVKRVFRYLINTIDLSITYQNAKEPELIGYYDSDFAGDYDTRKSTYSYLFKFNNSPISWKTKRQSTIALSITEAEFNSLEQAIREATWLKNLLDELLYPINYILIKGDNISTINLAHNPEYHQRTKHTALRYYYVRQEIEKGTIKVEYIPTTEMPADGLTKPLPNTKFQQFIQLINLTTKNI